MATWYQNKFFQYGVGTTLLLIIIFLLQQIYPILSVIFDFFVALLSPLILAGLLLYITRPMRDFLERRRVSRIVAIIAIFFVLVLALFLIITYVSPFVSQQVSEFTKTPDVKIAEMQKKTIKIVEYFNFVNLSRQEITDIFNYYLQYAYDWILNDIAALATTVTKIAFMIIFTPIILFFLLKDSSLFIKSITRLAPQKYQLPAKHLLEDMDKTLSIFITGQLMVSAIDSILIYIGYSIIGLNYALLLALFAFIFNIIPFIGTLIATVPALLVGFSISPLTGLEVVIVVMAVHILDANFISPKVLGTYLHIHPLTIILLLLASGSVFGVVGLLLATPIYAVLKVIVKHFYNETFA